MGNLSYQSKVKMLCTLVLPLARRIVRSWSGMFPLRALSWHSQTFASILVSIALFRSTFPAGGIPRRRIQLHMVSEFMHKSPAKLILCSVCIQGMLLVPALAQSGRAATDVSGASANSPATYVPTSIGPNDSCRRYHQLHTWTGRSDYGPRLCRGQISRIGRRRSPTMGRSTCPWSGRCRPRASPSSNCRPHW